MVCDIILDNEMRRSETSNLHEPSREMSVVQDIKGTRVKYIPGAAHRILLDWIRPAKQRLRRLAPVTVQDADVATVRIPQSALTAQAMGEPRWYRGFLFRPRWISIHGFS